MDVKYTPGPLVASRNEILKPIENRYILIGIAKQIHVGPYAGQEHANARLWALSPVMFDALKAWAKMLDLEEQLNDKDAPYPDIQGAYEQAAQLTRAALALAEGGDDVA